MRVFVTGGTGVIGRRLVRRLKERGDQPVVLSRHADRVRLNPAFRGIEVVQGDPMIAGGWDAAVDGCDAVVNLAGENIFGRRWSAEVKSLLRDSRIRSTEHIVDAIRRARVKPKTLVQGSAIGYYGTPGDQELTEESPPGDDVMASTCKPWEAAAAPVEGLGTRLATVRIGVVLSKGAGALGVMEKIFRYVPLGAAPIGSGGSPASLPSWLRWLPTQFLPGTGRQWLSWIHREDIVGLLLLALDRDDARGPINGTAPKPVTNAEFSLELTRALRAGGLGIWPRYVPIGPPDALLKLVLGQVAEVVTTGQRVLPAKALALGYSYRFPDLASALRDLFARPETSPRRQSVPTGAAT